MNAGWATFVRVGRSLARASAHRDQKKTSAGITATVSTFNAKASWTWPCARAWMVRMEPQPGHWKPVSARNGQVG